jgi:chromate transporter
VIANLAVYVAVATLFAAVHPGPLALLVPDLTTIRPVPLVIAGVAALLILVLRWPMLRTLGVCAVLGLAAGLAGLPVG